MKSLKSIVTAVAIGSGLLAFGPQAAAQSIASHGLIGKRYLGGEFAYGDSSGSGASTSHGLSVVANVPVTPTLDASVNYDFSRVSDSPFKLRSHTLTGSLLAFNPTEYGNVYFTASLGHAWDRQTIAGVRTLDNGALWGVGAGVEHPVGDLLAIDLGVNYSDSFSGNRWKMLQFRLAAYRWFTPQIAGRVSLSYDQISNGPDALTLRAGIRWTY